MARIDSATGAVIGKNIRAGPGAFDLTTGAGAVWVTNRDGGSVTRIDARTGGITGQPISVGARPKGIAFFAGSVWVANFESGTVTRFTPSCHVNANSSDSHLTDSVERTRDDDHSANAITCTQPDITNSNGLAAHPSAHPPDVEAHIASER